MSGLDSIKKEVQAARNKNGQKKPTAAESSVSPIKKTEAKKFVKDANKDFATLDFSWDDVTTAINIVQDYLTDSVRPMLKTVGIDGVAVEFTISGGVGAGVKSEAAFGLSVFFPVHTEFVPKENKNDDGSLPPHPINGAPFFFLFTSSSVSAGLQVGGGVDANAEAVLGNFWGTADGINRDSWAGALGSVDAGVDGGNYVKVAAEASMFASLKVIEKESTGMLTWKFPDEGWQGVALSGGAGTETWMEFKYKKTDEKSSTVNESWWE